MAHKTLTILDRALLIDGNSGKVKIFTEPVFIGGFQKVIARLVVHGNANTNFGVDPALINVLGFESSVPMINLDDTDMWTQVTWTGGGLPMSGTGKVSVSLDDPKSWMAFRVESSNSTTAETKMMKVSLYLDLYEEV
jgi:hypothetical protein